MTDVICMLGRHLPAPVSILPETHSSRGEGAPVGSRTSVAPGAITSFMPSANGWPLGWTGLGAQEGVFWEEWKIKLRLPKSVWNAGRW